MGDLEVRVSINVEFGYELYFVKIPYGNLNLGVEYLLIIFKLGLRYISMIWGPKPKLFHYESSHVQISPINLLDYQQVYFI